MTTPAAALADAMEHMFWCREQAADLLHRLAAAGWRVMNMEIIDGIGKWLSAALDDPNVCAEMKADIRRFFEAAAPGGEK